MVFYLLYKILGTARKKPTRQPKSKPVVKEISRNPSLVQANRLNPYSDDEGDEDELVTLRFPTVMKKKRVKIKPSENGFPSMNLSM